MKVQLRIVDGPARGQAFAFDSRDRFIVGRSDRAHLTIDDPSLSEHHFLLEINPPNVFLLDLRSTGGTFLNDNKEPVREARLRHKDQIRGGQTTFLLEIEELHSESAPVSFEENTLEMQAPVVSAPSLKLGDFLPQRASSERIPVRCLRCGNRAPHEVDRLRAEQVAYFCEPCQSAILDEPFLPPGYRLVREIGRGGMGAVYLIEHEVLGRRALKIILPRAAMSKKARDRFIREAQVQATLSHHPHIVQIYEFHELRPGIFCLVMEYFEGQSAARLLESEGKPGLPLPLAVEITAQLLDGLSYMHSKDIVHRDIKEGNLLVAKKPSGKILVKILDFGLAKPYETSGASGFTNAQQGGGTVPYMAPEQILNFRGVLPPADIYSAGVVLYRLLCGAFPHDFPEGVDRLIVVLEHPMVPLRQRAPNIPEAVAKVVERALSPKPAQRFATAQEMRLALLDSLSKAGN